jgi:hypothetical protein
MVECFGTRVFAVTRGGRIYFFDNSTRNDASARRSRRLKVLTGSFAEATFWDNLDLVGNSVLSSSLVCACARDFSVGRAIVNTLNSGLWYW